MEHVDEDVLADAEAVLHAHCGSLMDLPEPLRDTIASIYYEVHWLRRREGARPLTAHLPGQKENDAVLRASMRQASLRSGQYELVVSLVQMVREADKETQSNLRGAMEMLALDCLKWNIKNPFKKSEMRRSMEKMWKKPVPEFPRLYAHMNYLLFRREHDIADRPDFDDEWITLPPSAHISRF